MIIFYECLIGRGLKFEKTKGIDYCKYNLHFVDARDCRRHPSQNQNFQKTYKPQEYGQPNMHHGLTGVGNTIIPSFG